MSACDIGGLAGQMLSVTLSRGRRVLSASREGRSSGACRPAQLRRVAALMTNDRDGRVWGLVAIKAALHGGSVSAADACTAAAAAAEVTGAWLIAADGAEAGHL